MKSAERNSIIEICPIRNVVARFGDKWSLLVLLVINDKKTVRFNELARMIPDISTRMLSGTLKTLEADGLISRKVYPQVPPKVEYTLTDTGKSLIPLINQLTEWALKNMKRVMKHRADYDMAHN
ncbi:MAG: helix-turn-helix transcriptional regulator [Muribaculaceae bacterium]|nr:helix-turn-helix transcriptional regulator [Muribaculaceae bacterium]